MPVTTGLPIASLICVKASTERRGCGREAGTPSASVSIVSLALPAIAAGERTFLPLHSPGPAALWERVLIHREPPQAFGGGNRVNEPRPADADHLEAIPLDESLPCTATINGAVGLPNMRVKPGIERHKPARWRRRCRHVVFFHICALGGLDAQKNGVFVGNWNW